MKTLRLQITTAADKDFKTQLAAHPYRTFLKNAFKQLGFNRTTFAPVGSAGTKFRASTTKPGVKSATEYTALSKSVYALAAAVGFTDQVSGGFKNPKDGAVIKIWREDGKDKDGFKFRMTIDTVVE